MSMFVLVHGAWHGGWCWDRVAPHLRAAGHHVVAPTLTGLSERAHLLSPQVGLETHVEDVVQVLDVLDRSQDDDVVLVGHSYAGQVVTAAADRRPDVVSLRVHLDAFVGEHGESARALLPERVEHHWAESAAERGFGWLVPVRSLEVLGVTDPADVAWLTPRLTPHPWRTYTDALSLTGAVEVVPAAFVECTDWMGVFAGQAERARARGWPVRQLATGHEAMVTAPEALAAVLLELAAAPRGATRRASSS